jgi:hypothetical protein
MQSEWTCGASMKLIASVVRELGGSDEIRWLPPAVDDGDGLGDGVRVSGESETTSACP